MSSVNLSLERTESNMPLPQIRIVQNTDLPKGETMCSPKEVYELMRFLEKADREMMYALHLDAKSRIIAMELISVGSLNKSIFHPREVFKGAILNNSASIILVHNHPSGDVAPSKEDIKVTRTVINAGELLNIPLLDHVIIGQGKYKSIVGYMRQNKKPVKDNSISFNYLRQKTDRVMKQVISEDLSVYVLKRRIPIAVILPWKEYERLTI